MIRAVLLLAGLLSPVAHAAPACTVLSGATVHLADGPEKGVTVVLDGERIVGVGRALDGLELRLGAESRVEGATWQGADCDFRQVGGKVITSGLIEASSQLGLVEVELEPSTVDTHAGGDPIRAAMRVSDAYNPLSTLIPVQRLGGITGAVVAPHGGLVAGQGAFVVLAGDRQADAVAIPSVAVYAQLSGESRAEGILRLRELLSDVQAYARNGGLWERNQHRELVEGASRLDLEALIPVIRQEVPLVVGADRAADIESLLRLQSDLGFRLVITGAAEGWLVADALAEAGVPVVVDPLVYGPGGFDQVHARPDNAALLAEAGVAVVLSTFSSHNARTLRQVAGNAVREGMDHAAAVRAITAAPAQAFGLADRGEVRRGAFADLVVWSGDPLELSTRVEQVWIGGVEQPLRSRQTELRDAYRELPGTPLQPLPVR